MISTRFLFVLQLIFINTICFATKSPNEKVGCCGTVGMLFSNKHRFDASDPIHQTETIREMFRAIRPFKETCNRIRKESDIKGLVCASFYDFNAHLSALRNSLLNYTTLAKENERTACRIPSKFNLEYRRIYKASAGYVNSVFRFYYDILAFHEKFISLDLQKYNLLLKVLSDIKNDIEKMEWCNRKLKEIQDTTGYVSLQLINPTYPHPVAAQPPDWTIRY